MRIAGHLGLGRPLSAMQKDLLKNQKEVLETCRASCIEIAFATQCVGEVADEWVQPEVLRILANTVDDTTCIALPAITQCLTELRALAPDKRYALVPRVTFDDISSMTVLMANIVASGVPPSAPIDGEHSTKFLVRCSGIIRAWYKSGAPASVVAKLKFASATLYTGREAAKFNLDVFVRMDDCALPEAEVGLLRQFAWLLDGPDRKKLDVLVNKMVQRAKGAILAQIMLTDGTTSEGKLEKGVSSASASSGTVDNAKCSSVSKAVVPHKLSGIASAPAAKRQKVAEKTVSMKERMLEICCGGK